MSRHPARCAGWFATTPTGRPPSRPKPTTRFGAYSAWTSKKCWSSRTVWISSFMSYGLFGLSGTRRWRLSSIRSGRIGRRAQRRILEVVRRQEAQELPDGLQARVLALGGQVGDPRDPRMGVGAAELLEGHFLVRHRLEDLGTGHEHVGRPADHEREVRDRRGVDRAPGARAHDRRDLRHHARGEDVPEEDVGVAGERDHALLDARTAGIVQSDDRHADLEGQVHDLADLLRVGKRERAPEHGEILGEEVDRPPVDPRGPRDHAVPQDARPGPVGVGARLDDEPVELLEGPLVDQARDPLPSGPLAGGMLAGDPLGPAAELGLRAEPGQLGEAVVEAQPVLPDPERGRSAS